MKRAVRLTRVEWILAGTMLAALPARPYDDVFYSAADMIPSKAKAKEQRPAPVSITPPPAPPPKPGPETLTPLRKPKRNPVTGTIAKLPKVFRF